MCLSLFKSSIGKKAVMAVTGLLLLGFLIAHLAGNLQIFLGQDRFNAYAHHLQSLPWLLWPARVFLLTVGVVHVWLAIQLAFENKAARPVPYVYESTVDASLASRTMVVSGLLILLFVVYHLLHFTFGVTNPDFFHLTDIQGRHDVYSMTVLSFQNHVISIIYVAAMGVLLMHLCHGAPRFLQSLGLTSPSTLLKIERAGLVLAGCLFAGYCSIPLAVLTGRIPLPGGA